MQSLVKLANVYIGSKKQDGLTATHSVLNGIAKYLTRMLKIFGANDGEQEIGFPVSGIGSSEKVSCITDLPTIFSALYILLPIYLSEFEFLQSLVLPQVFLSIASLTIALMFLEISGNISLALGSCFFQLPHLACPLLFSRTTFLCTIF